jgi:hypothetical protein
VVAVSLIVPMNVARHELMERGRVRKEAYLI